MKVIYGTGSLDNDQVSIVERKLGPVLGVFESDGGNRHVADEFVRTVMILMPVLPLSDHVIRELLDSEFAMFRQYGFLRNFEILQLIKSDDVVSTISSRFRNIANLINNYKDSFASHWLVSAVGDGLNVDVGYEIARDNSFGRPGVAVHRSDIVDGSRWSLMVFTATSGASRQFWKHVKKNAAGKRYFQRLSQSIADLESHKGWTIDSDLDRRGFVISATFEADCLNGLAAAFEEALKILTRDFDEAGEICECSGFGKPSNIEIDALNVWIEQQTGWVRMSKIPFNFFDAFKYRELLLSSKFLRSCDFTIPLGFEGCWFYAFVNIGGRLHLEAQTIRREDSEEDIAMLYDRFGIEFQQLK